MKLVPEKSDETVIDLIVNGVTTEEGLHHDFNRYYQGQTVAWEAVILDPVKAGLFFYSLIHLNDSEQARDLQELTGVKFVAEHCDRVASPATVQAATAVLAQALNILNPNLSVVDTRSYKDGGAQNERER